MKHTLKIFLVLGAVVVICLGFNSKAKADTTFVSGTISTNTTWTPAGNPYIVIGGTRVDTNVTLTIQPGVIVKFNQGIGLRVDGAVDARGTSTDSIIFTASDEAAGWAYWISIRFTNSSIDSACFVEYCRIEKARVAIVCDSASAKISYNTITGNGSGSSSYEGHGILVDRGSSPVISYNTISDNGWTTGPCQTRGGGIAIKAGSAPVIIGNTISGNRVGNSSLYPSYGDGIYVESDSAIISNNVITGNGSPYNYYGGGIYINYASPIISCNMITNNRAVKGGGGIYNGGGQPIITSNTISGNSSNGPPVTAGGVLGVPSHMNFNNIHGNSDLVNSVFEVYAGAGSTPINAENNWWGTTDPNMIQLLIYDFWDYPSLREIDYTPFSTDVNTPPADSIIVISPNGGEEWWSDETYNIQWNPFCFTDNVEIEYSSDSGSSWESVIGTTINVGFYAWEVPVLLSPNCRVKVSDAADGNPSDLSDSDFTICPGPTIIVTYPAGGETLIVDSTYDVSWNTLCFDDNVKIEYSTNSGADWLVIVDDTTNIGSIAWTVPNTPSPNCKVKISDALDGDPFDISDDDFIIYSRGDANGDGTIDVGDVVYLINYLYRNGDPPNPLEAGDCNCDGIVDVGDVVYLINYLYRGGDPPSR